MTGAAFGWPLVGVRRQGDPQRRAVLSATGDKVAAIGEGVSGVAVGDRVAAAVFPRWMDGRFAFDVADQLGGSLDGMLTEYALLDADALVGIPDHLSYEQAATLPCAGVTAWHALTGGRGLWAGETVLTLGSGGVSLFAVQFAKAFGARVIATAGSGEKAERLRALGADEAIDYRATPNWHELVRELTGGGVDHVVEVTGCLEQSVRATAMKGEIAFVGLLSDGGNGVIIVAVGVATRPADPYPERRSTGGCTRERSGSAGLTEVASRECIRRTVAV